MVVLCVPNPTRSLSGPFTRLGDFFGLYSLARGGLLFFLEDLQSRDAGVGLTRIERRKWPGLED